MLGAVVGVDGGGTGAVVGAGVGVGVGVGVGLGVCATTAEKSRDVSAWHQAQLTGSVNDGLPGPQTELTQVAAAPFAGAGQTLPTYSSGRKDTTSQKHPREIEDLHSLHHNF